MSAKFRITAMQLGRSRQARRHSDAELANGKRYWSRGSVLNVHPCSGKKSAMFISTRKAKNQTPGCEYEDLPGGGSVWGGTVEQSRNKKASQGQIPALV